MTGSEIWSAWPCLISSNPASEQTTVQQLLGCPLEFGEIAGNIFCREAQETWEVLFQFVDDQTELTEEHGLSGLNPSSEQTSVQNTVGLSCRDLMRVMSTSSAKKLKRHARSCPHLQMT